MSGPSRGVGPVRGAGDAEELPPGHALDMLTLQLGQVCGWYQREIEAVGEAGIAMANVTIEGVMARLRELDDEC